MPGDYNRKNYRKRSNKQKYVKKKETSNKSTWAGAVASIAKPLIKYYLNPEYKMVELDAGPQAISSTPQFFLLNGLNFGTDFNQRIGRSIKMTKISIRGTVAINTASTANQFVRCMLVVAKSPNTVTPTAVSLLTDALPDINEFLNLDYRKYYNILYDKRFRVSTDFDTSLIELDLPLGKGIHTIYNGNNTGGITDIMTNAVYLVCYSTVTSNLPTVDWVSRIRYLDN